MNTESVTLISNNSVKTAEVNTVVSVSMTPSEIEALLLMLKDAKGERRIFWGNLIEKLLKAKGVKRRA